MEALLASEHRSRRLGAPAGEYEASEHRGPTWWTRNGLRVRVQAADCGPAGRRTCAGPTTRSGVRRPKELRGRLAGLLHRAGRHGALAAGPMRTSEVRVYFNVAAGGAAPLVAVCTRLLNEAKDSLRASRLSIVLSGFVRCDPAVLYLGRRPTSRRCARSLSDAITSACAPHLRADPPAFTKPLVRGVAVGEHRPQPRAAASEAAAAGWWPRASSPPTKQGTARLSRSGRCRRPLVRGQRARHRGTLSRAGIRRRAMSSDGHHFRRGRRGARTQDRGLGDLVRRALQLDGRVASDAASSGPERSPTQWRRSVRTCTEERAVWRCSSPKPAPSSMTTGCRTTALGAIRHALDHADRRRTGIAGRPVRRPGRDRLRRCASRSRCWVRRRYSGRRTQRAPEDMAAGSATRATASDVMNGCAGAVVGLVAL